MKNLLYIVSIFCLIGWIIGAFVFSLGAAFHLFLIISIIAAVANLFVRESEY